MECRQRTPDRAGDELLAKTRLRPELRYRGWPSTEGNAASQRRSSASQRCLGRAGRDDVVSEQGRGYGLGSPLRRYPIRLDLYTDCAPGPVVVAGPAPVDQHLPVFPPSQPVRQPPHGYRRPRQQHERKDDNSRFTHPVQVQNAIQPSPTRPGPRTVDLNGPSWLCWLRRHLTGGEDGEGDGHDSIFACATSKERPVSAGDRRFRPTGDQPPNQPLARAGPLP